MTIEECRERKRNYILMLSRLETDKPLIIDEQDYYDLRCAIARSIACEDLNIEYLERKKIDR